MSVLLSHFKCNFISLLVLISFILLFLASKLSFFKKFDVCKSIVLVSINSLINKKKKLEVKLDANSFFVHFKMLLIRLISWLIPTVICQCIVFHFYY